MARVTNFECDVCKALSKKVYEVQITVTPLILNNGDSRPTAGAPITASFQVDEEKCAYMGLEQVFKKTKVEKVTVSNGREEVGSQQEETP